MTALPGTLRHGGASFATTHWSVIASCADGNEMVAQLCRDYWPPLYSFVRRRGHAPADAQDLVQGFFAFFLTSRAYAQTDRRQGKFRSFLLASIKHYMADVSDRQRAAKRGGGVEFVLLDSDIEATEKRWPGGEAATLPEDQLYEQRWADTLVSRALIRLSEEANHEPKRRIFEALRPFLCGGSNLPRQDEVAADLEMPLETLRSHLSRFRARYRLLLRDEIKRTVSKTDSVDEELRHLCSILTTVC